MSEGQVEGIGEGRRSLTAGSTSLTRQLLITTTIAPTRAMRARSTSLSPQRLKKIRTSDLP